MRFAWEVLLLAILVGGTMDGGCDSSMYHVFDEHHQPVATELR